MASTRSEASTVRVIVLAADPAESKSTSAVTTVDMSLHSAVPMSTLTVNVAREMVTALESKGADTAWLREPDSRLVLAPDVGEAWDQEDSLADRGVRNGSTIILTTESANERYPALVESLPDGSAAVRNSAFAAWDRSFGSQFSAVAVPLSFLVLGLTGTGVAMHGDALVHWVLAGVLLAALAVVGPTAVAVSRYRPDAPSAPALGLSMHILAGATAASLVPADGVSMWGMLAGAAATTASAGVLLSLKARPLWGHAAAFLGGMAVTIGLAISIAWDAFRETTPAGAAAVVATVAFIIFSFEIPIARSLVGLSSPVLPNGGVADVGSARDVVALSREASTSDSWVSLIHDEDRNLRARNITLGNFLAAGAVTAACAFVSVTHAPEGTLRWALPEIDARWVVLVTYACLAGVYMLRGSWYRDRGLRAAATGTGLATLAGYLVGLGFFTDDNDPLRVAGVIAGGCVGVLIWASRSWRDADRPLTGIVNRRLVWLENGLALLIFINALTMINAFFVFRSL